MTGNYFVQWGNAASGTNNPLNFSVTNANPTIASLFASLSGSQSFALTIVADSNGQVTRNPLANRYSNGVNATLTALPASGQAFLNWSGDASGADNPLVVTMNQSRVITAHFSKRPSLAFATCSGRADPEAIHLLVTGEAVAAYEIQHSTNLLNWSPLATVTNLWGTVQHTDVMATNGSQRFYRALGL